MSPTSQKRKLPHRFARFIPAIALYLVFGAVILLLHFSSVFSSPAEVLPQPASETDTALPPAEFSKPPFTLRAADGRFSPFPRLDSDMGGGADYFDAVSYSFVDGHGSSVYGYAYGCAVPESAPVSDDYFSDAAFLGNSIMEGFMLYSGLSNLHVYAKKSISVTNISTKQVIYTQNGDITLLDALSDGEYTKVYIMLGINEISLAPDVFCSYYSELIADVRQIQPDADIYIQALTPVTREQSEKGSNFNKDRICEYNKSLVRLAMQENAHFMDIYSAMADEEGYLPSDGSFDGIHPYREYYELWRDYLKTHTISTVR